MNNEEIKQECINQINVLNDLVTVIGDKSRINVTEDELKDYKLRFINYCAKLEANMAILKSNNALDEELVKAYNDLNDRMEKKEFKELISEKEIKKILAEEETEKLLNDMIEKLKNETGGNPKDMKVVSVTMPKKNFLYRFVESLLMMIFNIILIFSCSGFIAWGEWTNLGFLVLFIMYYSLIQIMIKICIELCFSKLVVKTFGAILYLPCVIASLIVMIFPLFIEIKSYINIFIICILAYLIEKFFLAYIVEKVMKGKIFKKINENK